MEEDGNRSDYNTKVQSIEWHMVLDVVVTLWGWNTDSATFFLYKFWRWMKFQYIYYSTFLTSNFIISNFKVAMKGRRYHCLCFHLFWHPWVPYLICYREMLFMDILVLVNEFSLTNFISHQVWEIHPALKIPKNSSHVLQLILNFVNRLLAATNANTSLREST